MDLNKKIELILSLRNTSLTIWGFLITVAIGILAFVASLKNELIPLIPGIAVVVLYALFSLSNGIALYCNFKSRSELHSLATKHEEFCEYEKLVTLNVPSKQAIKANMLFHFAVDGLVVGMMLMKINWSMA